MFSKFYVKSLRFFPQVFPFSSTAAPKPKPIPTIPQPQNTPSISQPSKQESKPKPTPKNSDHRIKFAKPSDLNKVLNFLEKNFFCDDPLSKSLNLCSSKIEPPFEEYINCILCQGISLIALDNTRENQILGVSINQKSCRWNGNVLDEYADFTKDENFRKYLRIRAVISREPRMHEHLSQLMIFNLAFLSAKKDQEQIATKLANFSLNLARDMNFSHARLDCTNENSMKMARKFRGVEHWTTRYQKVLSAESKQPVVTLEAPNTHASAYYINLKHLPVLTEMPGLKFTPIDLKQQNIL